MAGSAKLRSDAAPSGDPRPARRARTLKLRLYVAGGAPNSLAAIANLEAMLRHIGPHDLEIVDVLLDSQRALADHVVVTPTLVRLRPGPVCRIVGTLGNHALVLQALGREAQW